jgi:hypothetical protein
MAIYPFEEMLFLFLYYFDNPEYQSMWVSVIVLVVCSTATFDKFLLKKQNDYAIKVFRAEQRKIELKNNEDTRSLLNKMKELEYEKNKLKEYIEKEKLK